MSAGSLSRLRTVRPLGLIAGISPAVDAAVMLLPAQPQEGEQVGRDRLTALAGALAVAEADNVAEDGSPEYTQE